MGLFNGMCTECSARASDRYFEVNNYGGMSDLTRDLTTRRPSGRPDYQMIYVKSGKVIYDDGGEQKSLFPGELLLFRPYEAQIYRYVKTEKCEYMWFHFSGTGCEELLSDLFGEGRVIQIGNAHEIDEAMADMRIRAIGDGALSKEYACGRMLVLFALLKQRGAHRDPAMENVLMQIHAERFSEGSNGVYAEIAGMSEAQFLRRFMAYVGTTPHRYKARYLLRQAAELLRDTEMNVGEIADAIGIEDGLYFSRIFKKEYGVSPTDYRNSAR